MKAESDVGDGFDGEAGDVGGSGAGQEGVNAAVEEVGHEVAGDGDEEGVRLLLLGGAEAGFEEGGRGVDATGSAGALKMVEVGGLSGGGRRVEDGGPGGGGGGAELGEFGGVVEGVEVDVGEQEDGYGLRRCGGGEKGGEEGEESEDLQESTSSCALL